jgi:hypothetical protein
MNRINAHGERAITRFIAAAALAFTITDAARAQAPAPAPAANAAPSAAAPAAPAAATPAPAVAAPADAPAALPPADAAAPAPAAPAVPPSATDATVPTATAPAADAPKSEADAKAEADALAALSSSNLDVGDATGDEFKLNLYGFADFTYTKMFGDNQPQVRPTFAVGNFNLYAGADLGDGWRTLTEVRFMYLPNGSSPSSQSTSAFTPGPHSYQDTTVGDYTDLSRPVKWGGISIQRVQLEKSIHPLLTIRMGQFLTPYGIWNVDHGSPVIIGVKRPYIVGESLFPTSQTGFEFFGNGFIGATELGYHLTLSNGRGPMSEFMDMDNNKAIGGRLYARNESSLGTITLGVSAYRGKYTARNFEYTTDSSGAFVEKYPATAQYDEFNWAADLKWELSGFLLQSELIGHDVAYVDKVRPSYSYGGPPVYTPDTRHWGVYGLTGYRFSFLGIMPFGGGEYYYTDDLAFAPKAVGLWGGINMRPTPRVVLKAQYTHAFHPGKTMPFPDADILDFQAAWGF